MIQDFKTLTEFTDYYKDEAVCRAYFENIRFAQGDFCPHCKHDKIMRFSDGKRYRCYSCKQDFTIKTGTLFGESKLPLRKWFIAIYLLTTRTKGISSIQLAKDVGVSQKTGWFMDHRIRESLTQNGGKLFGTTETDETYVGGKEKNKHWNKRTKHTQGRSTQTKTPIMGIFQRGGEARAIVVPNVSVPIVEANVFKNVRKGSIIYTDDFLSYLKLKKHYKHAVVSHGKGEYVRGDVHSNSAESFWALFKRGYVGTYHNMSKKHLQRYVNEFCFRFNRRGLQRQDLFADIVTKVSGHAKLGYKQLIANAATS